MAFVLLLAVGYMGAGRAALAGSPVGVPDTLRPYFEAIDKRIDNTIAKSQHALAGIDRGHASYDVFHLFGGNDGVLKEAVGGMEGIEDLFPMVYGEPFTDIIAAFSALTI